MQCFCTHHRAIQLLSCRAQSVPRQDATGGGQTDRRSTQLYADMAECQVQQAPPHMSAFAAGQVGTMMPTPHERVGISHRCVTAEPCGRWACGFCTLRRWRAEHGRTRAASQDCCCQTLACLITTRRLTPRMIDVDAWLPRNRMVSWIGHEVLSSLLPRQR